MSKRIQNAYRRFEDHVVDILDDIFGEEPWFSLLWATVAGLGLLLILFSITSSSDDLCGRAFLFLLGAGLLGNVFKYVKVKRRRQGKGITVGWKRSLFFMSSPIIVPEEMRLKHMHIVGPTGSGKTTLLKTMIFRDMGKGEGLAAIDPKGDLFADLSEAAGILRTNDTILFDATDTERPVGLNILEAVEPKCRSVAADQAVAAFKKLFADSWAPRLERVLRFSVLTLLEVPEATLFDIPPLLIDERYRERLLEYVTNPMVRIFWEAEYVGIARERDTIGPILTKVASWLACPEIRNIVGQPQNSLNLREVMDQGKVLLINIPEDILDKTTCQMLGAMLMSKLQLAAISRADIPKQARRPFYLYVDGFQNLSPSLIGGAKEESAFERILTQPRSFGLGLIVVNQYLEQLSGEMQNAINHNVAVRLTCRCIQEKYEYQVIYTKLQQSPITQEVLEAKDDLRAAKEAALRKYGEEEWFRWQRYVREASRERYGRPREEVERDILERKQRIMRAQA